MTVVKKRICIAAVAFAVGILFVQRLHSEGMQQQEEAQKAQHEFCPKFWANWDKVQNEKTVQQLCPQA